MPVITFADNFLAGAIISLVIPTALLVAVVIWYHLVVRSSPGPTRRTPRGASPEQPAGGNPPGERPPSNPPGESPPSGA